MALYQSYQLYHHVSCIILWKLCEQLHHCRTELSCSCSEKLPNTQCTQTYSVCLEGSHCIKEVRVITIAAGPAETLCSAKLLNFPPTTLTPPCLTTTLPSTPPAAPPWCRPHTYALRILTQCWALIHVPTSCYI